MEDYEYQNVAQTEPIRGYRLIEPLGHGGFGEVWKCEAPGGLLKAIKFVHAGGLLDNDAPADEELRAIQHVKAIRHPFMLTMERVEVVDGVLCIVMEMADQSLADVHALAKAAGKSGILRAALLRYLREAAEVLDVMNVRHGLQHLDIKPQNLFLVSDHVKVGDFGLVNTLSGTGPGGDLGPGPGAITPLYAAPEVFQGKISRHSDQYSLAIVYQELLTGTLPYAGKNSRQLLMQHLQGEPNLEALSIVDRPIIARALSKDPNSRFPSCTDLITALLTGETEVVSSAIFSTEPEPPAAQVETRRTPVNRTPRNRTPSVRPPSLAPEVMGGIVVGELLSRTPLSEVWSATSAAGTPLLIKVLFGSNHPGDESIARLPQLRHAILQPFDILHHKPGSLVLTTPPGERNFRELLGDYQSQGQIGIPRQELITALRLVAEGLNYIAETEGIYHLALTPRAILLDGISVRVADFGLAQLVWLPAGQSIASLAARYAAPELLRNPCRVDQVGNVLFAADQYSLALVYHELLIGAFPSPAPSTRRPESVAYVLDRLPEEDRAAIARALDPDPRKRWPTLLELINALDTVGPSSRALLPVALRRPDSSLVATPDGGRGVATRRGEMMQTTTFGTSLSPAIITQRLEGFRKQWNAREVLTEALSMTYQMPTPRSFWQRFTGKQPSMEIRIQIIPPDITAPDGVQLRTELRMDLHPEDCTREQSAELLKVVGPLLVESMRVHMAVNPRGRAQERMVWHHSLQLCEMLPDGQEGPPIECQGKDISLNGIGFYLPGQLPSSQVILHLPKTPQTPRMAMPARIVRVQGCGDGWFEVGAVLLPPDVLPTEEDESPRAGTVILG